MKKTRKKVAKHFLKKYVVKAKNSGNGRGGGISWREKKNNKKKPDSMANGTLKM